MGFDIFPPIIDLYPSDVQLFTARASHPPLYWRMNAGLILPDGSVRTPGNQSGGTIQASGAFRLAQGAGSMEWTLTPQSLPISGANIDFIGIMQKATAGTFWQYIVRLQLTSILIVDEAGSTLATLPITPVSGMKIRIEMNGNFRAYIDDVLRHERLTFASAILYPGSYAVRASGSDPFVQSPPATVAPPRISGDWRLLGTDFLGFNVVAFSVEHGSLGAGATPLEKIYSGGTVPGRYSLKATIQPGVYIWIEDDKPAGSSVSTSGGSWVWGTGSPTPFSGSARLKSPLAAGDHGYVISGASDTLQIDKDDVLICRVFLDATNPPTEILLGFTATDATGNAHGAYWGANSIVYGTDGTPSRWRIGNLPATNQWVLLEIPANLVDLEGRTLNGMALRIFDGVCSFDFIGKYPGRLQLAEAIINIPALKILSDLTQTIQPSAKARFQANYDDAQTPGLVTWSVVSGGGSFSGNEFTAPSAPGTTVVRASSTGNQAMDATINVPAVITPAILYAGPLEQVDFNTNITSPTWTSVPSGINGSTGIITFPNTPGAKVRIQATNGTFTATRDILIAELFPLTNPILPISWDRNLNALISESEDRTSFVTREKAPPYDSYEVRFAARTLTECDTVDAFFDAHGFGKVFILVDSNRGVRKAGRFDSVIHHEGSGQCAYDLSFRFKEARVD